MLENNYFNKLSKEYEPLTDKPGGEALIQFKKYFSRRNIIKTIRNKFAFHYSPIDLNNLSSGVPEEYELYIQANGSGNHLYYFAEVLANRAILRIIDNQDEFNAYKKLMREIPDVVKLLSKACDALIYEFLDRVEAKKGGFWKGYAEKLEFTQLPTLSDIKLPWFIDLTELSKDGT